MNEWVSRVSVSLKIRPEGFSTFPNFLQHLYYLRFRVRVKSWDSCIHAYCPCMNMTQDMNTVLDYILDTHYITYIF